MQTGVRWLTKLMLLLAIMTLIIAMALFYLADMGLALLNLGFGLLYLYLWKNPAFFRMRSWSSLFERIFVSNYRFLLGLALGLMVVSSLLRLAGY